MIAQDYGTKPVEFGSITLAKSSEFQTFTLSKFCREATEAVEHKTIGEAIDRIDFDDFDCEAVAVAVTQIGSPIELEAIRFHSKRWSVYRIAGGVSQLVGHFIASVAKAEFKRLQDCGEPAMIGTPYLASYGEGD